VGIDLCRVEHTHEREERQIGRRSGGFRQRLFLQAKVEMWGRELRAIAAAVTCDTRTRWSFRLLHKSSVRCRPFIAPDKLMITLALLFGVKDIFAACNRETLFKQRICSCVSWIPKTEPAWPRVWATIY